MKEPHMSRTRLTSALAGCLPVLVAATAFTLAAAPQGAADSPGVTVDVAGATLLHRAPIQYPESARAKRIHGAVVLELTFDASGNVSDARVINGPDELRRSALQSALQWHFARESAGGKRQVTISFALSNDSKPDVPVVVRGDLPPGPSGSRPRTIRSINVVGLPEDSRRELLSRLSARIGTALTPEVMLAMANTVREFDEHLSMPIRPVSLDEVAITIVPMVAGVTPRAEVAVASAILPRADGERIKVGGNEQHAKLIRQPRPVYPQEAKEARIQGVVKLMAVIAKDGTIQNLEVLSGHPILVPASLDAVKQWVYSPTLLNGNPVEVQTQIDVNFTLSQ
jgi:TonB family protein